MKQPEFRWKRASESVAFQVDGSWQTICAIDGQSVAPPSQVVALSTRVANHPTFLVSPTSSSCDFVQTTQRQCSR